ncbi:DUF6382 domain-containing protein [Thalassobacillus hwangdonensis]|uniref:DUF6382 domain-containing protein n=1 Tax=Thalassobacillus hwangdonensis TaxID=546108 RepID=A0ABW3KZD1_9BACI
MDTTIFGYTYDFNDINGFHMMVTNRENTPLSTKDLNPLQMKMIQSNDIPRLLPIMFDQVDLQLRLHYDLRSKKMLDPYLKEKDLTWNEFAHLLINVIEGIESSSLYMMNRNHFVIDKRFIFIGKDSSDVFLTYLPFKEIDRNISLEDEFKKLITDVAEQHEHLHGSEYEELKGYMDEPTFNLDGLKEVLLSLSSAYVHQRAYQEAAASTAVTVEGEEDELTPEDMNEIQNKKKNGKGDKANHKPLTQRELIYLFAGSALAIALMWKMYDMTTQDIWFEISMSFTLIVVVFDIIYINRRRGNGQTASKASRKNRKKKVKGKSQAETETIESGAAQATAGVDTSQVTQTPFDTQPLGEGIKFQHKQTNQKVHPYLTVNRNGEIESINIKESNFLIGRNAEKVHYVEDIDGVSRIHAELVTINNSYGVKDLGSKNGTVINGNALVPYKVYELKDNDQLEIGSSTFTFHHPETYK